MLVIRRSLVTFLISVIIVCLTRIPAAAQPSTSGSPTPEQSPRAAFAIVKTAQGDPGYFEVEVAPGDNIDLSATVVTVNSIPVTLRAYSANAYTSVNGGFGVSSEDDSPKGPTTWISFPAQTFELMSNDSRDIAFSVSVPEGTQPGQYVTALVAQTAEPLPIGGSTGLNQVIRSAIAVVIEVPGETISSFALGNPAIDASSGAPLLIIPTTNTGNTLVRPGGVFIISTTDGEEVVSAPVELRSVYAFTDTTIQIALPEQFSEGDYLISGTLTDPESGAVANLESVPVTYSSAVATPQAEVPFSVGPVSIEPTGDPVQYAIVSVTLDNNAAAVPTGKVILGVSKDGELVENYTLSANQAIPSGTFTVSQRYIPPDGWSPGTFTFRVTVIAVDPNGTETVIATVEATDTIEIADQS